MVVHTVFQLMEDHQTFSVWWPGMWDPRFLFLPSRRGLILRIAVN